MKMEAAVLISTTTTSATVSLAHQVMTRPEWTGGGGGGGGIPLRFTKCQYSGKKSFEALAAK